MTERKQHECAFIMFKEWDAQLKLLTIEQRGILLTAIYDYQCRGIDFESDDNLLNLMWTIIRQAFERNERKYYEICERNRQRANKRWHPNDAAAYDGTNGNANDAI